VRRSDLSPSSLAISMRAPLSFDMELIVSPPFPINMPINSWAIWMDCCCGLEGFDSNRRLSSNAFKFSTLLPRPSSPCLSRARLRVSSIIFLANSTHSGGPVMCTSLSSGFSAVASLEMSMRAPLSFFRSLIVSPFLPMRMPTNSCEIFMTCALGFVAPVSSRALFRVSSIMALAFSTHALAPLR